LAADVARDAITCIGCRLPVTSPTAKLEPFSPWDLVLLTLSVYVLGGLLIETLLNLPEQVVILLDWVDNAVCVVFLGDFFWRLASAKSKLAYLKWGWLDLLSSIPSIEAFRLGRLYRVIRLVRVLRNIRSFRAFGSMLYRDRASGGLLSAALVAFLVVVFSAIAVLHFETVPSANIRSAGDALWWSFEVLAGQASGVRYPMTTGGRFVGAILMTVGFAVFGVIVATIASLFMRPGERRIEHNEEEIVRELHALDARLKGLERRHSPSGQSIHNGADESL
jgi:voltage-gated potassium channel